MRNTEITDLEIRRLSECSFDDAAQAWNEGFQGYFVDMTLSLDRYLARLHYEGLSPEFSLMAFSDGTPAGFLLNGIRTNPGPKVAWNGGTGVSPQFRGRGLAKEMVTECIDIARQMGLQKVEAEFIGGQDYMIQLAESWPFSFTHCTPPSAGGRVYAVSSPIRKGRCSSRTAVPLVARTAARWVSVSRSVMLRTAFAVAAGPA